MPLDAAYRSLAAHRDLLDPADLGLSEVQHELGPDVDVLLHGRPLGEHRRP